MDKFLGIGLVNALGLWALFVLFSCVAKVLVLEYKPPGITDVILTGA